MEWDYGEYEGETTPDIRRTVPGWSVWTHGCPGGESPEEVGARCDELIRELIEVEGDVVCFAHGHILRVLGARWMDIAPGKGANLLLSTGTLSVLGWERTNRAIRLWNDGSHLG
jgi:probable phosphoglycerate mutase